MYKNTIRWQNIVELQVCWQPGEVCSSPVWRHGRCSAATSGGSFPQLPLTTVSQLCRPPARPPHQQTASIIHVSPSSVYVIFLPIPPGGQNTPGAGPGLFRQNAYKESRVALCAVESSRGGTEDKPSYTDAGAELKLIFFPYFHQKAVYPFHYSHKDKGTSTDKLKIRNSFFDIKT